MYGCDDEDEYEVMEDPPAKSPRERKESAKHEKKEREYVRRQSAKRTIGRMLPCRTSQGLTVKQAEMALAEARNRERERREYERRKAEGQAPVEDHPMRSATRSASRAAS